MAKVRATLVNLYSDTQTRPSSAMRKAMAEAEVGDEQRFEDPQVTELCERVAALFGMEAAVFLPSGTMCNEIAFRLHIRPGGDEAILHRLSHPIIAEAGGPAAFAGAMMQPLDTPKGMFTGDDVRGALRYPDRYSPRSRLVSVEQTTNMAGGRVWPLEQLRGVVEAAREHELRLHMDGARLMNAVVASGVPAAEMAQGFDTAWLDFTKGLGAPLGACLAGSAELVEEAWRYKQMIGGALRQAGIVAAGALYALDHNVERLALDHENAATLARGIADVVEIDPGEVETNIVIFEVDDPDPVCEALEREGVRMGVVGERQIRAVTHLDVDADEVQLAVQAVRKVLT